MLVGPSKCLKQTIQIELKRAKSPNWPEANQLVIYKCGRGFELGTTENKSSQRSERDLNSGPPIRKSSALTTRSRYLLRFKFRLSLNYCDLTWSSSPLPCTRALETEPRDIKLYSIVLQRQSF